MCHISAPESWTGWFWVSCWLRRLSRCLAASPPCSPVRVGIQANHFISACLYHSGCHTAPTSQVDGTKCIGSFESNSLWKQGCLKQDLVSRHEILRSVHVVIRIKSCPKYRNIRNMLWRSDPARSTESYLLMSISEPNQENRSQSDSSPHIHQLRESFHFGYKSHCRVFRPCQTLLWQLTKAADVTASFR